LAGHTPLLTDLAFHPSGELLASGAWDGTVRIWHPATARQIMQLPVVGTLQFSGDGRWLGAIHRAGGQVQLLEVTLPREYRTMVSSLGAGQGEYLCCAVSPDNQLLAVGMGDGVRLWNLASHRELAFLDIGVTLSVEFTADTRALLTCGTTGLKRWPISPAGADDAGPALGPPRDLPLPFRPHRFAWNREDLILGIMSEADGRVAVLNAKTGDVQAPLMTHPNVSFIAMSPNSRWLATSGWHSDRIRLWETQTSKLAWEHVVGKMSMVSFTPDNRELIVSKGSEFIFFDLNTFEVSRRLVREPGLHPGDVAFTPDGDLMAMEMSPAVIHLKEVATGKTIGKLEDPYGDRSTWMTFTPDAARLIAVAGYADAVHIWDLRAIRVRLKEAGLDWDWSDRPSPSRSANSRF
jgi:WD40 repeat protein